MLGLGSPRRPSVNHVESGSGHGGAVGQRALVAMAEAARRAREASDPTGVVGSEEPIVVARGSEAPPAATSPQADEPARDVRQGRGLRAAVLSVALLVLLAATVLAITLATRESPVSPPVNARAAPGRPARSPGHSSRPAPTGRRSTPTSSAPLPSSVPPTSSAPPTSTVPAAGGGVPVLSALSPSTGVAGQTVVISGANFISADGVVQARFGGQLAPTACPVQTSCTVTVPAMTGSPASVPVTVTTDGGTSNPLTFTFG